MDFKGTKRAQEYAKNKSTSEVFREAHYLDFLCGYNQALNDTKAPEMLEMLQFIIDDEPFISIEAKEMARNLIEEATEI